jgi:hypothetical protein
MTAWARWSWTSGRTSPSSPTQPASVSEQPAAATGHVHSCHPPPGWLFKTDFIFCLFGLCSHPSPAHPRFQFLLSPCPNSVVPAADASSLSFVLGLVLGDCPPPAPDGLLRGWRFRFFNTGPCERGAWSTDSSCLGFWPGHCTGSCLHCCFWIEATSGSLAAQ